jgi:hypothetical protein
VAGGKLDVEDVHVAVVVDVASRVIDQAKRTRGGKGRGRTGHDRVEQQLVKTGNGLLGTRFRSVAGTGSEAQGKPPELGSALARPAPAGAAQPSPSA